MKMSFALVVSVLTLGLGVFSTGPDSRAAAQDCSACNTCRQACGTWDGCTASCPPWESDGGACINQCQQQLGQCWAGCGCAGCAGSAS